jgi:hypothetical protein
MITTTHRKIAPYGDDGTEFRVGFEGRHACVVDRRYDCATLIESVRDPAVQEMNAKLRISPRPRLLQHYFEDLPSSRCVNRSFVL